MTTMLTILFDVVAWSAIIACVTWGIIGSRVRRALANRKGN